MRYGRTTLLAASFLAWAQCGLAIAAEPPSSPAPFQLGVTVERTPAGLLVDDVRPGSASARAGLAAGDVIVTMNGAKAKAWTPEEIDAAFSQAYSAPVLFTVRRGNAPKMEIRVTP